MNKEELEEKNRTKEEKLKKLEKEKKRNKIIRILLSLIIICFVTLIGITIYYAKNKQVNIYFGNNKLKYSRSKKYTNTYMIDVSEIIEDVVPSIVSIYGQSSEGNDAGTGIVVGKNKTEVMILTNNHVIKDMNNVSVRFNDEKSYIAKIKGKAENKDIAILSININDLDNDTQKYIKVASIGYSGDVQVGDGVIAIGNALGSGQTVTTGIISALNRNYVIEGNNYNMFLANISVNAGNSGGALIDSKGKIIGIITAKYSTENTGINDVENMGLAIPITDVSNTISILMNDNTY